MDLIQSQVCNLKSLVEKITCRNDYASYQEITPETYRTTPEYEPHSL